MPDGRKRGHLHDVQNISKTSGHAGPENRVPTWLAVLVAVLLVGVLVTAGLLVRVIVMQERVRTGDVAVMKAEQEAEAEAEPKINTVLRLAFQYQQRAQYDRALEKYDRALEMDSDNLAALYNRGIVLKAMGKTKAAEAALWDVLEIQPSHAMAAKSLGELYAERGQYRSMLVAVQPAARANPAMADLQYLEGLGLEKLGRMQRARAAYQRALTYDPDLVAARKGIERIDGGVR